LTKIRREFQSQVDELQDDKYNLENQNSKLSKRVNELKVEINEFGLIKSELNIEVEQLQAKVDELNEILVDKDLEIENTKQSLLNANELLKSSESKLADVEAVNKETVLDLKKTIADLTEEMTLLKSNLSEYEAKVEELKVELKTIDDLKVEVNNKQLLIGKLRHEAIILNEHLTKSLTMLKQGNDGNSKSIDKELISNVIVSFLQFPRGDTKKFEALQLISALLEWDQVQRVAAGLSHVSGGSVSQDEDGKPTRQSFVNLWTEFLEKESRK
jgi:chromosome segregation ATPase